MPRKPAPTLPTKLAAYSYARVSTSDQQSDGTSLESQTAAIKVYAEAHGFEVVQEFREVYTGAELWERPLLNKIRDDVRARKVQAVIAYAIDRLSRDVTHLAILYDEAERHGVQLLLATEEIDNTPEGKLLRSVRGYVAEVERQKIKERTIRGRRQRLLSGKVHNSGRELYGYVRDRQKGVRIIVEDEAATVRAIFHAISQGQSTYAVACALNDAGTLSPFAAKGHGATLWNTSTIRQIIKNPNYKGDSVSWRTRGLKSGAVEYLPESEWIRLPAGTVPAIVTPETWQAANAALPVNVGDATRNQTRAYLLRGLIVCSVCGRRCYPVSAVRKGARFRYYRCKSIGEYYRQRMPETCGADYVPANDVEAYVWQEALRALSQPEVTAKLLRSASDPQSDAAQSELAALRKTFARLEQGKARLLKRLRLAEDDLAALIERELLELDAEARAVAAKVTEAANRTAKEAAASVDLALITDLLRSLASAADDADFDEQCAILRAMGAQCFASGRKWRVAFNLTLAG